MCFLQIFSDGSSDVHGDNLLSLNIRLGNI